MKPLAIIFHLFLGGAIFAYYIDARAAAIIAGVIVVCILWDQAWQAKMRLDKQDERITNGSDRSEEEFEIVKEIFDDIEAELADIDITQQIQAKTFVEIVKFTINTITQLELDLWEDATMKEEAAKKIESAIRPRLIILHTTVSAYAQGLIEKAKANATKQP